MRSFSELTGKEKAVEVVRWLCVPIVAVLAGLAIQIIAGFIIGSVFARPPGFAAMPAPDFQRLLHLFRAVGVLMAAAFVIAGAFVAPRCRLAAALVLVGLWTVYSLLSHVLVHLGQGKPHYLDFALAALAAFGAAAYIFYSERAKGDLRPQ